MKKVLIILFCSLMLCSCSNSGKNVSLTAMSDDVVTLSVGSVHVPRFRHISICRRLISMRVPFLSACRASEPMK